MKNKHPLVALAASALVRGMKLEHVSVIGALRSGKATYQEVAIATGLNPFTIRRYVEYLRDRGWVDVEKAAGKEKVLALTASGVDMVDGLTKEFLFDRETP